MDVLHPLLVPLELRRYTTVLAQKGEPEDLVRGRVRAGVFLTSAQLKELHAHLQFDLPAPGAGHGTNGNITKRDYAEGLVRFLLKDAGTQHMVDALMGGGEKTLGTSAAKHTDDLLTAFNSLDPQDQPSFEKLATVAADESKRASARAARADVAAAHAAAQHETPKILNTLLPQGKEFVCKVNRHPGLRRYQIYLIKTESRARAAT